MTFSVILVGGISFKRCFIYRVHFVVEVFLSPALRVIPRVMGTICLSSLSFLAESSFCSKHSDESAYVQSSQYCSTPQHSRYVLKPFFLYHSSQFKQHVLKTDIA